MSICDVLIGVDNVNKDIVSESIYELTYSIQVNNGQSFFTIMDVETDPKISLGLVSLNGALEELGATDYAMAVSNLENRTLVFAGNPDRYGMKAILTYGIDQEEPNRVTH